MITVRAKRSLTIFLSAALYCAVMSGVLFLCSRFSAVWPFFFTGIGLLFAALVAHFLGNRHFGRGFYCATVTASSVACGALIASFYNHIKINHIKMVPGIPDLVTAYIFFTGLCLLFSIAFIYINYRFLFGFLCGALLLAAYFLCLGLIDCGIIPPLFFSLSFFFLFFLCTFFLSYLLCYNRRRGVLHSMSLSSFFSLFFIVFFVLLALTEGDGLDGIDFDLPGSAPEAPKPKPGTKYPWL